MEELGGDLGGLLGAPRLRCKSVPGWTSVSSHGLFISVLRLGFWGPWDLVSALMGVSVDGGDTAGPPSDHSRLSMCAKG